MLNQFSNFVDEKAIVQWPSFLHHVQREPLSQSKDTVELLQCIVKDQFFNRRFPEIQKLTKIALTIPLSTTWAQRGFSIMAEIRTKKRNRLSDEMLSSLITMSMHSKNL